MIPELAALSARDLSERIRRRELSPVELTDALLAPHRGGRSGDQRLHHGDRRPRPGPGAGSGSRDRRGQPARAASRHSLRSQGHPRHRRHPHHERLPGNRRLGSRPRVHDHRPAERSRRRPDREAEPPGVRDGERRALGVRACPESVGDGLHPVRFLFRFGRRAGGPHGSAFHRHRHRRLDPRTGRRLRHRRG